MNCLLRRGRLLRELLEWELVAPGVVAFRIVCRISIWTIQTVAQLELLATLLIANFPDLLYHHSFPTEVRVITTPVEHPLTAHLLYSEGVRLSIDNGEGAVTVEPVLSRQADVLPIVQHALGPTVKAAHILGVCGTPTSAFGMCTGSAPRPRSCGAPSSTGGALSA